jgi:hypothetical protein
LSSDSNPYAPPGVAETEAPSSRYWYSDGTSLIVRNGATLPKVDLDTGISEGPMEPFQRIVNVSNPLDFLMGALVVGGFLALRSYANLESVGLLIPLLLLVALLKRLGFLRGNPNSVIRTFSFIQQHRARRATLRRRFRIGIMILIAVSIFATLFLSGNPADFVMIWFQWVLPGGVLGIIGLAIWGIFDRPRTKTRSEAPGWMRITGIHPDALNFLLAEEQAIRLLEASRPPGRKRLVRTVFYHRFPLRLLIGNHYRNPLVVLRAVLMKFFRSSLLVRETYHFSEAVEVPLQDLCEPLRQAAESWLASHPDWSFVSAERLNSPAGDLMIEHALVASPGLEHCARINRVWLEQKPGMGSNQFTFITWLADGNHFSTLDQPYLPLKNPHLHQRASGTPEEVYQAHLRGTAALAVSPSRDHSELLARLQQEKEESDRLLTDKGFQSEVREAA